MSTIKVNTIETVTGVEVYTKKAWVNFNGTGTITIRNDGNVSSVTDYNTGWYGLSFSSSMSSADYILNSASTYASDGTKGAVSLHGGYNGAPLEQTTSAVRVHTGPTNQQAAADMQNIFYSVLL